MNHIIRGTLIGVCLIFSIVSKAQTEHNGSELAHITETIMDYIEGTANGQPERLRKAFYPDFNLYTVTSEDSLRIRSGKAYISNIKDGEKSNRNGRI